MVDAESLAASGGSEVKSRGRKIPDRLKGVCAKLREGIGRQLGSPPKKK
jgi:hypothetical protein